MRGARCGMTASFIGLQEVSRAPMMPLVWKAVWRVQRQEQTLPLRRARYLRNR